MSAKAEWMRAKRVGAPSAGDGEIYARAVSVAPGNASLARFPLSSVLVGHTRGHGGQDDIYSCTQVDNTDKSLSASREIGSSMLPESRTILSNSDVEIGTHSSQT